MVVRAFAIVCVALLVGMLHSNIARFRVSLPGGTMDPYRTEDLARTEDQGFESRAVTSSGPDELPPVSKEDEDDAKGGFKKRGGFFIRSDEAKRLFDLGVPFFDARVKEEFDEGHIKGAHLMDPEMIYERKKPEVLKTLDQRKPVVVYCGGGDCDSSTLVALRLRDFGFTNVSVYEEGYPVWKAKGFPVQ